MESCSNGGIEFYEDGDLDIYAADVSRTDPNEIVSCLLAVSPDAAGMETVVRNADLLAIVFPTPFYTLVDPETEQERPAPAALIRTENTVYVVQPNADHGLKDLQHVRGDIFVITSGYVTHDRNYLFRGTVGDAPYIRDGRIEVENSRGLLFRVIYAKSFWKPRGAFWYDAVIDQHGHILDIVTPRAEDYVTCMSLEELVSFTRLDLSRVSSAEVCVRGVPPRASAT